MERELVTFSLSWGLIERVSTSWLGGPAALQPLAQYWVSVVTVCEDKDNDGGSGRSLLSLVTRCVSTRITPQPRITYHLPLSSTASFSIAR